MAVALHLSDGEVPRGWLPIGIADRHAVVRWMQVGADPLSDPFFSQSIERLRKQRPRPLEFETSAGPLACYHVKFEAAAPLAVIFHMSRCGSTLMLNGLRAAHTSTVALGEAQPVERALQLAGASHESYATGGRDVLRSLITLLAWYRGSPQRNVVLKLGIHGICSLGLIRAMWPRATCIILIRDPTHVLVSNLQAPPPWLIAACRNTARCWPGKPPQEAVTGGPQSLGAWMIGRFCVDALQHADDQCTIVDYEDLDAEMIHFLAERSALQPEADFRRRLDVVLKADAKRPTRDYVDDRERKSSSATDPIRRNVDRWANESYLHLRSRRTRVR